MNEIESLHTNLHWSVKKITPRGGRNELSNLFDTLSLQALKLLEMIEKVYCNLLSELISPYLLLVICNRLNLIS